MNKTMIYGMLTALFALASCMGNGNPVSLSDLEGEWNVVELAGQSVNTKQQPFIGFDTREMRVYGYGGCNRLMGSFEWSDESARMVMDKLASTMMCPNIETEFEVLAALKEVTTFGMLPNGHVGLFAAGSVQVLELAKRKN